MYACMYSFVNNQFVGTVIKDISQHINPECSLFQGKIHVQLLVYVKKYRCTLFVNDFSLTFHILFECFPSLNCYA